MKRLLLALMLGLLPLSAGAALIHHWPLSDNAANTTVDNTVGADGTLEGGDNTSAKTTAGPGGSITAGFDFNGSDDAVDISAASVSFASGTAFSVSLWFNADGVATGRLMGRDADDNGIILKTADTTIRVGVQGSAVNYTVGAMGTTNWHHLLVTRTAGNSVRVFLDTVESSSGAQSLAGLFAPLNIGLRGPGNFSDGPIAGVKIFDSDESANVASLYAEGTASSVVNPLNRSIPGNALDPMRELSRFRQYKHILTHADLFALLLGNRP